YHLIPAWSGLALCGGTLALDRWRHLQPHGAAAAAMAAVVLMAWAGPPFAAPRAYAGSQEDRLAAFVARFAKGRRVLWLAEGVWPEYPAMLYAGAAPGMADMDLWLPGMMYRNRAPGIPDADETALFQRILSALRSGPPALVVVEPGPTDFIAY